MPYLNLDNSYYSFIETFFNWINLNFKNKLMTNLHLECQMTNIPNLSNLISYNLTTLTLGHLDLITFKSLVKFFHSDDRWQRSVIHTAFHWPHKIGHHRLLHCAAVPSKNLQSFQEETAHRVIRSLYFGHVALCVSSRFCKYLRRTRDVQRAFFLRMKTKKHRVRDRFPN